jgi:hypothetical protein
MIAQTHDGGNSWRINTFPGILVNSIRFVDGSTGFATGMDDSLDQGIVLTTVDGGKKWSRDDRIISESFNHVRIASNGVVCLAGKGYLAISTDKGASWQITAIPFTEEILAHWFVNDSVGWICGENELIAQTKDRGKTWITQHRNESLSKVINGMCFIDDKTGWAVGDNGMLLKTSNGGINWVEQQRYLCGWTFNDICSPDGKNIWTTGDNAAIVHGTFSNGSVAMQKTSPITIIAGDVRLHYPTENNTGVSFRYSLPHAAMMTMDIFNLRGTRIKQLIHNETRPAGNGSVVWYRSGTHPGSVAPGNYLVRLSADKYEVTRQFIISR